MTKIDKDGSGTIEIDEFMSLMTEVIDKRDATEEFKKVFRCYDNDDDGKINLTNLRECADILEMESQMNEVNLSKMIEIGDRKKNGFVDQEDFIHLMKELGLSSVKNELTKENKKPKATEDAKPKKKSKRGNSSRVKHLDESPSRY